MFEHVIFNKLNDFMIIGAMDGITHDNFINKIKHRKLNLLIFVEPVKYYFDLLKINASILDGNIYFENLAISDDFENLDIVSLNPEFKDSYPSWYDGCSCVIENGILSNKHINFINESHRMITKSKTYTISYLLEKYDIKKLDYLQIDTEGYDERILNSINFESLKIKFLRFERWYGETEKKYIEKMEKIGYIHFYDGIDTLLVEKNFFENEIKINLI